MLTVRRVLAVVTATAMAAAVSGCGETPVPVGLAGVGVGPDGHWVGYLQVCSDAVDGADVYVDKGGDTVTLGRWTAVDPVTGFAAWDLEASTEGWRTNVELTMLRDDTEYSMFGRSDGSSTTAGAVHFTRADLSALRIGEVIYWSGSGDDMVVGAEEDFRSDACHTYQE